MNNLKKFCQNIEHAPFDNTVESSDCQAIKFDDTNGFVNSLSENYANNCRVDYIEIIEQGLIMIELKDLKAKILNLPRKDRIDKNKIQDIFQNILNKFNDSLQILQNNIDKNLIPTTNYLVWKNNTDIAIMDKYLPKDFRKRPYKIYKTNQFCQVLSSFNTRLCQK